MVEFPEVEAGQETPVDLLASAPGVQARLSVQQPQGPRLRHGGVPGRVSLHLLHHQPQQVLHLQGKEDDGTGDGQQGAGAEEAH